jgi:hypothetical protein
MTNSDRKRAAVQKLWDVYCGIFDRRGVNLLKVSAEWAEEKRQSLKNFSAMGSFDNLCRYGCAAIPLAITFGTIRPIRTSVHKWQGIAGGIREREQKIRALEKAADVLEDLLGSVANQITADLRGSMDPESIDGLRDGLMSPNQDGLKSISNNYFSDPAITMNALRQYASILENTNDSPDIFVRYLISAYVYRATREFHDAEVSALIGAAQGDDYEATAHKAWRNRNYDRLDANLGFLAEILMDLGRVLGK